MSENGNIIEIKGLCKSYKNGSGAEQEVLKDLELTVGYGEMTAIIGKSGSGKSTLLNILGCVDNFEKGNYLFCGNDITEMSDKRLSKLRGNEISFVFQDYALIEEESVLYNIETPLFFNGKKSLRQMKKAALETMKALDISDLSKKKVSCLSGGQKQRVGIARAIINEPKLILADEPTGALDGETADLIMNLFSELNSCGTTVIIVTHDEDIAAKCSRVLKIKDGKIQ